MGDCYCSMFCYTLLCVYSSIAIILMGKRELVALLNLSSWCLVMVEWLFLAVPWGCLRFVIVVFPDRTHYFLFNCNMHHHIHLSSSCSHMNFWYNYLEDCTYNFVESYMVLKLKCNVMYCDLRSLNISLINIIACKHGYIQIHMFT